MSDNQRNIILEKAMSMYLQFGLRSVSMDQIASELGISKKTIYRHFENKGALVHEGIMRMTNEVTCFTKNIHQNAHNPIDELFAMDDAMQEYFTSTHERLLFQLKKYYPETYHHLENIKRTEMVNMTVENLERGISEGIYRDDFDPHTIARLYLGQAYMIMNDDFFWKPNVDKKRLRKQALMYHLHGIVSDKGRTHLKNKHQE